MNQNETAEMFTIIFIAKQKLEEFKQEVERLKQENERLESKVDELEHALNYYRLFGELEQN